MIQKNSFLRARADVDTKIDTVCAGSTIELHEITGKVVDVYGLHDSLRSMKNITVRTCITALDLEDKRQSGSFRRVYILGIV